jgi:Flp pilus assembly protein TadG
MQISMSSKRKNERGSVLAYTVLSALFLFLAVGLSVDLSHLYLAKTELQNSADAAALAAASALSLPITNPSDSQPYRIPEAVNRAIQILNQNNYNFNNRSFNLSTANSSHRALVRFAINLSEFDSGNGRSEATAIANPTNIRFIRVTTPSVPITTFFSVPILGVSKNLDARAVSGMSVPGNLSACIAPLSAVSCAPNSTTCSLCDPGDPLYPNCTSSKYWGNCGGANPYELQTVAIRGGADDPDGNGTCDPKKEFCMGCTYNIRSEGKNQQGPQAGNFQILACAGSGANAVRDALAAYGTNCSCGQVSPGDEVTTEPGVAAGAVRDGLNVRFDIYSSENGSFNYDVTRPPDTNIAQGACIDNCSGQSGNGTFEGITYDQYAGTGTPPVTPVPPSHPGKGDRRALIIPIIPITEFTDSQGRQTVNIGSLAGFFMRAQVGGGTGGDIQVEYIGDKIKGIVGFDPNDNNVTNIVTPVLYR